MERDESLHLWEIKKHKKLEIKMSLFFGEVVFFLLSDFLQNENNLPRKAFAKSVTQVLGMQSLSQLLNRKPLAHLEFVFKSFWLVCANNFFLDS